MEKDGYSTPAKTRSVCGGHCVDEVCSVCLSPFDAAGGRFTPHSDTKKVDRGAPVQTKCNVRKLLMIITLHWGPLSFTSFVLLYRAFQHTFHQTCLNAARRWKSECPLCRSALSPILLQIQLGQSNLTSQPTREEIVQAANRARNAVRLENPLWLIDKQCSLTHLFHRLAMIRRNTTSAALGSV